MGSASADLWAGLQNASVPERALWPRCRLDIAGALAAEAASASAPEEGLELQVEGACFLARGRYIPRFPFTTYFDVCVIFWSGFYIVHSHSRLIQDPF